MIFKKHNEKVENFTFWIVILGERALSLLNLFKGGQGRWCPTFFGRTETLPLIMRMVYNINNKILQEVRHPTFPKFPPLNLEPNSKGSLFYKSQVEVNMFYKVPLFFIKNSQKLNNFFFEIWTIPFATSLPPLRPCPLGDGFSSTFLKNRL